MIRNRFFLSTLAFVVLLGGVVTGCGGDDDSTDSAATDTGPPPSKSADSGDKKGSGPASAGDESKNAPDKKISDRPGGPNTKPPVNPDPVK